MSEKKKNLPLILSVLGFALLSIAAIVYFWYIHTPYYAVQQVSVSLSRRDAQTFYKYFDASGVVGSLTDELFFQPAIHTRGMSEFQNFIAAGAIVMTKNKMDAALLGAIDRMVSPPVHTSYYHVFPERLGEQIYAESFYDSPKLRLVTEEKLDLRDIAKSIGQELKTEQQDLKRLAFQRMQEYAVNHQGQLIGRLMAGPQKGESMKTVLAQYGFDKDNFKRVYFHKEDDREICTAEFFSPKVNKNVPISIELLPINSAEILSQFKIARMWKVKETMAMLGEDTDTQVQELVRYSLQDIAPHEAADRTRHLLQRIGKHEGAKKLLDQLKKKL